MIREAIAGLVERHGSLPYALRGGDDAGWSCELWRGLAEGGCIATMIPEELGGAGLGLVEMGIVLEELGAGAASGPYLGTALFAGELFRNMPHNNAARDLAALIATGRTAIAAVLPFDAPLVTMKREGGRRVTVGQASLVLYGAEIDLLLCAVRYEEDSKFWLLVLPASAQGVDITSVPTVDQSRRTARISFSNVDVEEACFAAPLQSAAVESLHRVGAAGSAAEMLGGAGRVLDISCRYALERRQFGQPIGGFQAIKHLLADNRVMLDGLRSLVYSALWQQQNSSPAAAFDVHAAKSWAAEAYSHIAAGAIQVFGAMGFASETEPHVYLKRAQLDRHLFGSVDYHQQRLSEYLVNDMAE